MEHQLNVFRADLYNVFVEGNANGTQIIKVLAMLIVPVFAAFMTAAPV
jgi:hypothetical protein